MEFFKKLDKLKFPVFVCSDEWYVLYRNTSCKKYTTSPRVNSKFDRFFFDKERTAFPNKNGEITLVGCMIRDVYKTALCIEYRGYALIMFPSLLDFDLLFADVANEDRLEMAHSFRYVLDALSCDFSEKYDKYSVLEKIRKYSYSSIDNYVTLSMFDTEKRVLGSVSHIYKFFCENIIKTANKAGYKIFSDFSSLEEFGDGIYTDTSYFTMILSGILLFCLSVSKDKKAYINAVHNGNMVRNTISFTYKNSGRIDSLFELNPAEYLNFIPFEELCRSLGWDFDYKISDDEQMNVSVWFDVNVDSKIVFRSPGESKTVTPEEIILSVIFNMFGVR